MGSEGHPEFLEFAREVAIVEDFAVCFGNAFSGVDWLSDDRINGEDRVVVEVLREPQDGDSERYRDLVPELPDGCFLVEQWLYLFDPGSTVFKGKELVSRAIAE